MAYLSQETFLWIAVLVIFSQQFVPEYYVDRCLVVDRPPIRLASVLVVY